MLSINLEGNEQITLTLDTLERALDVEEILDLAAASALSRIRQRFHLMVAPDGTPWTPSKAAIKEGRNTLLDTGRLFNSIQLYTRVAGLRIIGTDVEYAVAHNDGIGQLKREFMGLNEDDVLLIQNIILARIQL